MELGLFLIVIVIMVLIGAKTYKNSIRICKGDCIFSNALNEKRKFWVYTPKAVDDQTSGDQHYPVVYLLDAEEHFRDFTEMIEQVNADGSKVFPDMIVVGIPNTKRSRDLTPTRSIIDARGKNDSVFKSSGGGEAFIEFIGKELIPHIDSIYLTTPYKVLIGHSLGGLTAVNILLNHTALFDGYIASDPSMWWDDKLMLNHAREAFKQPSFAGKSLYVSIANEIGTDMDMEQIRRDTSPQSNHTRCIIELTDILESNPGNGLRSAYKYYVKENHNSVTAVTRYDGLRFLLNI
jgi:predicted alpha/beta superfamily hydrolase